MIDVGLSSKYVSDKLPFSSLSQVSAFFQIATFQFFVQRNPYTETYAILFTLILGMFT